VAGIGAEGEVEVVVGGSCAEVADEEEVAFGLVVDEGIGFFVGDPVGQQVMGVFAAVGKAAGDAGHPAQEGRGQRILAICGKDDCEVEVVVLQLADQLVTVVRSGGRLG